MHAGFWKRLAAALIDGIALSIAGLIIGILFLNSSESTEETLGAGYFLGLMMSWIYYAAMESSTHQGTLGKLAIGIKVTDMQGNRIGFGKASGRHFGKFISVILLCIGYLMAAFTEKKQALHDIMAGCLVVNKS